MDEITNVSHEPEAASRVFHSIIRLMDGWTAPPVMRAYLSRAGVAIDPTDFQALLYIGNAGPVKLRDVAAGTNMTASNASKIVADLVAAGLVARRVPDHDRRVTLLEVTEEGREAVVRLNRAGREMTADRLAGFSAAEVDTLAQLLGRLASDVAAWASELTATGAADAPDARAAS